MTPDAGGKCAAEEDECLSVIFFKEVISWPVCEREFLAWIDASKGEFMSDFSALSALLGAGLPATFTFLYQRLANLLDRQGAPETEVALPVPLRGELALPLTVDEEQLAEHQGELELLRDALGSYHRGESPVDVGNPELLRVLGRVRGRLEGLYGQRLTFQGEEDRQPSGPFSRQKIGTVHGHVTGLHADDTISGYAETDQDITTVAEGATVTGMRARNFGGQDNRPRR
ncbi:hypothetical protein OG478_12380 [Streptomyces phaeochromogenes]|uniref:hypothetical protein n=1 Tax=Streptomyces phaeochromogenes TaxID=1923 RepID=UPI003864465F|nr:hypothetical protein OG478_12380 [Streptomyces phaeochromogenes]